MADGSPRQDIIFPYPFRPGQEDIVLAVKSACQNGGHLVMESGTGTGKTVCTLAGLYAEVLGTEKKLIYTTRTNSQQRQVLQETREIAKASVLKIPCVGLQGRNNLCLLLRDLELSKGKGRKKKKAVAEGEDVEEEPGTIEELAAYCSKRRKHSKSKVDKAMLEGTLVPATLIAEGQPDTSVSGAKQRVKLKGCVYYENLLRGGTPAILGDPGEEPQEARAEGSRDLGPAGEGDEAGLDIDDSLLAEEKDNIYVEWLVDTTPDTSELLDFCLRNRVCPYELSKMACRKAKAVVVPYIYFFAPFLRLHLLDWLNVELKEVCVVVDEAHNLPDYARELQSSTLTRHSLDLVEEEAKKFHQIMISEDASIPDLCAQIEAAMMDFLEEYLVGEDGVIPDFELEQRLLGYFRVPSPRFKAIIGSIIKMGLAVKEQKMNQGRLPSSHLYSFGNFLLHWLESAENHYVHLITKEGSQEKPLARPSSPEKDREGEFETQGKETLIFKGEDGEEVAIGARTSQKELEKSLLDRYLGPNPALEIYCLDPGLTTKVLNECHMSVHMSGTLKPMEQYVDSIDLDKERLKVRSFPSPFPRENRRYLFASDVTTRYQDFSREPAIRERIDAYLKLGATGTAGRNSIFFFPSFRLLKHYASSPWVRTLERPVFVERQGMPAAEHQQLVSGFRGSEGGLLFSVMGGRTSEGIDFPAKELELVVVVGIPYPKPTMRLQALQLYNQHKFGKGYFYTFHAPTSRKLAQALGRLIRTEEDRGIGIILDMRASRFRDYLPELEKMDSFRSTLLNFRFMD